MRERRSVCSWPVVPSACTYTSHDDSNCVENEGNKAQDASQASLAINVRQNPLVVREFNQGLVAIGIEISFGNGIPFSCRRCILEVFWCQDGISRYELRFGKVVLFCGSQEAGKLSFMKMPPRHISRKIGKRKDYWQREKS